MAKASVTREHYLKLNDSLIESAAYRDLSLAERALLIEFAYLYRPARNGHLSISTRNAVDRLRVAKSTAENAFYGLAAHGFIRLTNHQDFFQRKAREWSITWEPVNGRESTNEWKHWQPGVNLCPIPCQRKAAEKRETRLNKGAVLPIRLGQSALN